MWFLVRLLSTKGPMLLWTEGKQQSITQSIFFCSFFPFLSLSLFLSHSFSSSLFYFALPLTSYNGELYGIRSNPKWQKPTCFPLPPLCTLSRRKYFMVLPSFTWWLYCLIKPLFLSLDTLEDNVFSCLLLSHIKPLLLKGSSKFNNLLNTLPRSVATHRNA